MQFDISELEQWTDVIGRAPAVAMRQARAVVSKGSLNIKNEARQNAPGDGHAKHYPASINYDITETPLEIMGEIGPAKGRRQWGLGNLIEYGSGHSPPRPHLEPALDHEAPKFLLAVQTIAGAGLE